jgi:hypothetical protein
MKERRCASIEQPLLATETDSPRPDIEELPTTVCQDPVTETSPENNDPQHSACDSLSADGHEKSENVYLPVTPEACNEGEELRVVREINATNL